MVLSPEEWVRQHVVEYLTTEKKYPLSHINVEKQIIVECKAPSIKISQETFDQIARYNFNLDATYLMVTNGLAHYHCKMLKEDEKYQFLKEIPEFSR